MSKLWPLPPLLIIAGAVYAKLSGNYIVGVWLTALTMAILAAYGAAIVLCPIVYLLLKTLRKER